MQWIRRGRAWKFGDNLCPDISIGWPWSEVLGDLRRVSDSKELKKIFMVRIDPELPNKVREGDFIVAGKNFGIDRTHPPFWNSLRAIGIGGIIAESFAMRCYRPTLDMALPILECVNITAEISQEDELEVNFKTGAIKNLAKREEIKANPMPEIFVDIIEAGGTTLWVEKQVRRKSKTSG